MTARKYRMPREPEIGSASENGAVRVNPAWSNYFRGIEDGTARVAANLPAGATTDQLLAALKAAGLMEADS